MKIDHRIFVAFFVLAAADPLKFLLAAARTTGGVDGGVAIPFLLGKKTSVKRRETVAAGSPTKKYEGGNEGDHRQQKELFCPSDYYLYHITNGRSMKSNNSAEVGRNISSSNNN